MMNFLEKTALIAYLANFVTEQRREVISRVLDQRTRYITLVLEDIFQPHNISAVIRSCDCFGVQDVHIVEQQYAYRVNPDIAVGSSKWITLHRHKQTQSCFDHLKQQGYQIAAMTLQEDAIPIDALPPEKKTALCFGTEKSGLSKTAHQEADFAVFIPMHGFTQSFNISVCAALALQHLTEKVKKSPFAWPLTEAEKLDIKIQWLKKIVPHGELVAERFLSSKKVGAGRDLPA